VTNGIYNRYPKNVANKIMANPMMMFYCNFGHHSHGFLLLVSALTLTIYFSAFTFFALLLTTSRK